MKILVVDDDLRVRTLYTDVLRAAGHETATAANGREAIAAVRRERPDVVVTDLDMPELDGFQLIRLIREDPNKAVRATRIIAVSGENQNGEGDLACRTGASLFLAKPVSIETLRAAVETEPCGFTS